jgi:hypothetical protein
VQPPCSLTEYIGCKLELREVGLWLELAPSRRSNLPVPPTWIPRLAEILAAAQKLPSTDLDREQIMRLFRVKRRTALLLMKQLEPKMVRGSWRIDRSRLAAWLEEQMHDSDREVERQKRLTRALITADISLPRPPGAFLSITATQEMRSQAVQGLPPGVSIDFGSPSRLEVEFQTLEELAAKLIQAGLALDRNFDHYASLLETGAKSSAQTQEELERQDAEFVKNWRPS